MKSKIRLRSLYRVVVIHFFMVGLCHAQSLMTDLDEAASSAQGQSTQVQPPGQVLVRFKDRVGQVEQTSVLRKIGRQIRFLGNQASRQRKLQGLSKPSDQEASPLDSLAVVDLDMSTPLKEVLQSLKSDPRIAYAEPNFRLQLDPTIALAEASPQLQSSDLPAQANVPNDFEFQNLWGLHSEDSQMTSSISATEAWRYTQGSRDIVVAVIDTGIDQRHPDLTDNLWVNRKEISGNASDDDGNGYIDDVNGYDFINHDSDPFDDNGHGSHVSGTIGALGNNKIGVAGVCWRVSLMALKAFDSKGSSDLATVVQAVYYAAKNGARVINASWGGFDTSSALSEAIASAQKSGALFVAAAGNSRSSNLFYPAAYDHVVAVGATTSKNEAASFSNYGSYVDLAAPGEMILSTMPGLKYAYQSGTSMATPHVSGAAGLILSLHPEFTNEQLENILKNAVDPLPLTYQLGNGRLNLAKAVRVTQPLLEVDFKLPSKASGLIDLRGAIKGDGFQYYSLKYGKGPLPSEWTLIHESTEIPSDDLLSSGFSTASLDEGLYSFELTAVNRAGGISTARRLIDINNVRLSAPLSNDVLRAGEPIAIMGTVFDERRTYTLEYGLGSKPTTWSRAGIELTNNGRGTQTLDGVLALWNTHDLAGNQFYTLRLASSDGKSSAESYSWMIYLERNLMSGWPHYVRTRESFPPDEHRYFQVADLDHDHKSELVIVNHATKPDQSAQLMVFSHDGNLSWTKDLGAASSLTDVPAIGDVNNDGAKEIFVSSAGQLFAFSSTGSLLPGAWPVAVEKTTLTKVLGDLKGDGQMEIIAYSSKFNEMGSRQLSVWNAEGKKLQTWTLPPCTQDFDDPQPLFPALAALDSAPGLEIVAVSGCGSLSAFKLGRTTPLWTTDTAGIFVSSPVTGDLDHDGKTEIVVGSILNSATQQGGLYAFDSQGRVLNGWPVLNEDAFINSPALADFDGTGQLSIVVSGAQSQKLHRLRPNGFEAPGWPIIPTSGLSTVPSSPVIGDVNGDGQPDIVVSLPGTMSLILGERQNLVGGVKAWTSAGIPLNLSGREDLPLLVMESFLGRWKNSAPPVLADIDGNGKLDIIASSRRDRTYPPGGFSPLDKFRSSFYVWELDVPYNSATMAWPSSQGGADNAGGFQAPKAVNHPPELSGLPDQVIGLGSTFAPIALDLYSRDPDNSSSEISWSVAGARDLIVHIDEKHMASIALPSSTWAGRETLKFTARDPQGLTATMSASFEVRSGFRPPHTEADFARVQSGQSIEIDVLANDGNADDGDLSLASVGTAHWGDVIITPYGTLSYTAKPYLSGTDSFYYTVVNARGETAHNLVTVTIDLANMPPTAVNDDFTTNEDTPVLMPLLANDFDRNGDSFRLVELRPAHHGALTSTKDAWIYSPQSNFNGLDTFTYVLEDDHGARSEGTVQIMVRPVNDAPVSEDIHIDLHKNSFGVPVFYKSSDPDLVDSDLSKPRLTYRIVSPPQNGTYFAYPDIGNYRPHDNFVGTDFITYTASDGVTEGNIATVYFNVSNTNNPPEIASDPASLFTKPNQTATIQLFARDADKDPVTFEIVSPPEYGSITGNSKDGRYTYTPSLNYVGSDSLSVRANDGQDVSATLKISLNVSTRNTAPVTQDSITKIIINTPSVIPLLASDPESDPLTFTIMTYPKNGVLTKVGEEIHYAPHKDYAGYDRFTYKVSDGVLESRVTTATLQIDRKNEAPLVTDQGFKILSGKAFPILLAIKDLEGDSLVVAIAEGTQNGTLQGTGTDFTYTPRAGFVGRDSFTYAVWDGRAYSARAKVTFEVVSSLSESELDIASITLLPNKQVEVSVTAPVGNNIQILATTDYTEWTLLSSTLSDGHEFIFKDTEAPQFEHRFYKARQY